MKQRKMERRKAKAVFMAFGTKGDVYPLAVSVSSSLSVAQSYFRCSMLTFYLFQAIAAAFACDQKQYDVILITHSAHQVCIINISGYSMEHHFSQYFKTVMNSCGCHVKIMYLFFILFAFLTVNK